MIVPTFMPLGPINFPIGNLGLCVLSNWVSYDLGLCISTMDGLPLD